MKKLNLIANFIVDVIQILNEEVQDTETQKGTKKAVKDKVGQEEQNEDNLTDFETIKNLMNESEKLKKTSDEELNIMRSFLNSLTDNEE